MNPRTVAFALAVLLFASCKTAPVQPQHTFDVRRFGATGDSKTLDTDAINRAIESAAQAGGGTVVFPAGTYASYSIHLKSNVGLYLDHGATLLAADPPPEGQPGGYDAPEPNEFDKYQDFGHTHWRNSLLWGENLENISITGPGKIFGRGLSRGGGRKDPLPGEPRPRIPSDTNLVINADRPFGYPNPREQLPAGVGNKAIALKNCRHVLLRDFTVYHGGHFAFLLTGCDDMHLDNLTIDTNRDGIDLDCCRNTTVSNCRINSPHDDGLCPKSSYGLGEKRITENLTIVNCQLSGFEEGTFLDGTMKPRPGGLGRIKFGTESNGGFRNVTIANCTFRHCRGLAIEEVDGGILENISVDNLTMMNVVHYAIYLRLGRRNRGPEGTTTGTLKNIFISNVIATGIEPMAGVEILGIPDHPIEGVRLQNIRLQFKGGGTAEQAQRVPPEQETVYPEPSRMGVMPAYGLYARHVRDLEIDNFRVGFEKEDLRPPAVFVDVDGLEIDNFKAQVTANVPPARFEDVKGLVIRNSPALEEKH